MNILCIILILIVIGLLCYMVSSKENYNFYEKTGFYQGVQVSQILGFVPQWGINLDNVLYNTFVQSYPTDISHTLTQIVQATPIINKIDPNTYVPYILLNQAYKNTWYDFFIKFQNNKYQWVDESLQQNNVTFTIDFDIQANKPSIIDVFNDSNNAKIPTKSQNQMARTIFNKKSVTRYRPTKQQKQPDSINYFSKSEIYSVVLHDAKIKRDMISQARINGRILSPQQIFKEDKLKKKDFKELVRQHPISFALAFTYGSELMYHTIQGARLLNTKINEAIGFDTILGRKQVQIIQQLSSLLGPDNDPYESLFSLNYENTFVSNSFDQNFMKGLYQNFHSFQSDNLSKYSIFEISNPFDTCSQNQLSSAIMISSLFDEQLLSKLHNLLMLFSTISSDMNNYRSQIGYLADMIQYGEEQYAIKYDSDKQNNHVPGQLFKVAADMLINLRSDVCISNAGDLFKFRNDIIITTNALNLVIAIASQSFTIEYPQIIFNAMQIKYPKLDVVQHLKNTDMNTDIYWKQVLKFYTECISDINHTHHAGTISLAFSSSAELRIVYSQLILGVNTIGTYSFDNQNPLSPITHYTESDTIVNPITGKLQFKTIMTAYPQHAIPIRPLVIVAIPKHVTLLISDKISSYFLQKRQQSTIIKQYDMNFSMGFVPNVKPIRQYNTVNQISQTSLNTLVQFPQSSIYQPTFYSRFQQNSNETRKTLIATILSEIILQSNQNITVLLQEQNLVYYTGTSQELLIDFVSKFQSNILPILLLTYLDRDELKKDIIKRVKEQLDPLMQQVMVRSLSIIPVAFVPSSIAPIGDQQQMLLNSLQQYIPQQSIFSLPP